MSKYYAINKETGRPQRVPDSVIQSVKNDQSQVRGFDAFLKMLKYPMINWADYTNHKIDGHFINGVKMAQKSAIKGVINRAKQLNRH